MIFADGSEVWKALLAFKQKNVKLNRQYERGLLCSVISICSANFVVDWIENDVNDIKKVKPKVAKWEKLKPGIIKYLKGSAPLGEVLSPFTGGGHLLNMTSAQIVEKSVTNNSPSQHQNNRRTKRKTECSSRFVNLTQGNTTSLGQSPFCVSFSLFLSRQIDLKKMPLGKLTKRQIETAYAVLGEAQKVSGSP